MTQRHIAAAGRSSISRSRCAQVAWPPIALVALCACAHPTLLTPAAGADRVHGLREAAAITDNEIRIIAQATDWPGDARISKRVTPLRVRVENQGVVPIRMRYRDFKLVTPDERVYHAVPPLETRGTVTRKTAPIEARFTHYGYAVARPYAYAYPGLSVWDGAFAYDPYYIDNYYPYWSMAALPTRDMIEHALPEGVLRPGGSIDGYLYFQRVDEDVPAVDFVAQLANAQTGRPSISASIPFRMESAGQESPERSAAD